MKKPGFFKVFSNSFEKNMKMMAIFIKKHVFFITDYSLISYSYLKKPGFEKTQGKNRFI